jgi:hypothetical protein
MELVRRKPFGTEQRKNQILRTDLKMWRDTLGVKRILKQSGTMLADENAAVSFAVTRLSVGDVGSPYFSKSKRPSVVTGELNLTVLSPVCETAFNTDGICRAVQKRIPLVKKPTARNSRLNKADKTNNVFFERDICSRSHFNIQRPNIK